MHDSSEPQKDTDFITEGLAQVFLSLHYLGVQDRKLYSDILRQTLSAHPEIFSAWTVWEPDSLDGRDHDFCNTPGHDATGRFIPCWHRAEGEPVLVPVAGYENPNQGDWYWTPKRHLGICKLEPIDYCFGTLHVRIRGQISPIIEEGKFCGAAGIDFQVPSAAGREHSPRQKHLHTTPIHRNKLEELSPREREVFHWLEMGKTNEEIGIILGISHHTVKHHLESIFQKLGVNNRREAVISVH